MTAVLRVAVAFRGVAPATLLVLAGVVHPGLVGQHAGVTGSVAAAATSGAAAPERCVQPTRHATLYAVQLPAEGGAVGLAFGFTPESASIPGPLIEMLEGECLGITVVNDITEETLRTLRTKHSGADSDLPLGVSLHVHGVKYTTASDGTIHTGSFVPPGRSRTYTWYAAPRVSVAGRVVSLGTAGYWWYHDHVIGTDHGTGGLESGLFGALVVRRPGDVRPDVSFTAVMGPRSTINLRTFPATFACDASNPVPSNTCFVARKGARVEFAVVGVGDDFHVFHLHGHNWANNRTGILASQADETQLIDAKTIGPSETFGFQIIAGEEVGPGDWMLHCHVQKHSDDGMVTFFRVLTEDGVALPAPGLHHHGAHH